MVKPISDTGGNFPILYYNRPDPNEPYAYDPNSGTMESHYGIGRLGTVYHPLDVFRKFPPPPANHWGHFFYMGGTSFVTVSLLITVNKVMKRPAFAGIWQHVLGGIGGAYLGHWAWKRSRYNAAVRDAHFQRYIELHPEDFPPIGILYFLFVTFSFVAFLTLFFIHNRTT